MAKRSATLTILVICIGVTAIALALLPSVLTQASRSLQAEQQPISSLVTGLSKKLSPVDLETIPGNRWVLFHQALPKSWRRPQHAGIAYDSKRAVFYVFGSDTHGRNWDNSVHEFDPEKRQWLTHYPASAKSTYRADRLGRAIAGEKDTRPWAMHTYDNILYDPSLDALVVTALPEHNYPAKRQAPDARIHPTWIYHIPDKTWRILENNGQPYPKMFAAASAYDSKRDVVVGYKWGVWELASDREQWERSGGGAGHRNHYSMVYDTWRGQLAVFGDSGKQKDSIWLYSPGRVAGAPGTWEEKIPQGDDCLGDQHFPVAFDQGQGVFLLVTDYSRKMPPDDSAGNKKRNKKLAKTCTYDPVSNTSYELPDADMPAQQMNYMMVYDSHRRVFFMVTGKREATVWVLRLDLDKTPLRVVRR